MAIVWAVFLVVLLLVLWATSLFGLPGNWFMLAAVAFYAWIAEAGRTDIGWMVVIMAAVLAALGEMVEFLAGAAGVAKAGGSKRGALLALAGSMIGGLGGLFVGVPVPVVGPIIAALLLASVGALIGAIVGERSLGRTPNESWRIGTAAFWGRLLGTVGKVALGAVMFAVVVVALFV